MMDFMAIKVEIIFLTIQGILWMQCALKKKSIFKAMCKMEPNQ